MTVTSGMRVLSVRLAAAFGVLLTVLACGFTAAEAVAAGPEQGSVGAHTPLAVAAEGQWKYCTLAAIGLSGGGGRYGVTAGHCGQVGDLVYERSGDRLLRVIGRIHRATSVADGDVGLVALGEGVAVEWSVRWGGGSGREIAGVLGPEDVAQFDRLQVCSQGATSGFVCGEMVEVDRRAIRRNVPSGPGDSGAGLFVLDADGRAWLIGVHVAKGGLGSPVSEQLKTWGVDVRSPQR